MKQTKSLLVIIIVDVHMCTCKVHFYMDDLKQNKFFPSINIIILYWE